MSMTSTDPIADMLSRIRNAINVNKRVVSLPHSNIKEAVAKVIMSENFIEEVKVESSDDGYKSLVITINNENTNPKITEIERLSRPGRRWYASTEEIPVIKQGRGIVVISTSKGLMSGAQAKKNHLGGELICKVY